MWKMYHYLLMIVVHCNVLVFVLKDGHSVLDEVFFIFIFFIMCYRRLTKKVTY